MALRVSASRQWSGRRRSIRTTRAPGPPRHAMRHARAGRGKSSSTATGVWHSVQLLASCTDVRGFLPKGGAWVDTAWMWLLMAAADRQPYWGGPGFRSVAGDLAGLLLNSALSNRAAGP